MTALPEAMMYVKMAQTQLGLPLNAPEKPKVFPADPVTNLELALSLIQSELDVLKRTRG